MNVRDYGAVGDGVTDDTAAFRAAMRAGTTCYVPQGTYALSALPILDDTILRGDGKGLSVLKPIAPFDHNYNGLIRAAFPSKNWHVEGLTVDMQGFVGSGISTRAGDGWSVLNCEFLNVYNWGINTMSGSNWRADSCEFTCLIPEQGVVRGQAGIIVITSDTNDAYNYYITNNRMTGTDISAGGRDGVISGNIITGVTAGTGIFTTKESERLIISNNICSNGRGRDANRTWISGYELWGKRLIVTGNVAYGNDGGGLAFGCNDSLITGNLCYDNGQQTGYPGMTARYLDADHNANGSIVIGNRCFNSAGADGTQNYGFAFQNTLVMNLQLGANSFKGNKVGDVFRPTSVSGV